jgi:transcriptional regulator with XRE-family HTH domain
MDKKIKGSRPCARHTYLRSYLKDLRKERGYTIEALSEEADMSSNHYQLLELGKRGKRLSLQMAYQLAQALRITIDELYKLEMSYLKKQESIDRCSYD